MTPEQLQRLSKDELIEIILQLQARVAELEKQIERLTGSAKDCTNSSVAPSRTRKPNSSDQGNKKRGPGVEALICYFHRAQPRPHGD